MYSISMYENILNEASIKTDPSAQSKAKMDSVAKLIMDRVVEHSAGIEQIIDAQYGGSYAKDTWIGNDSDVDIFVRYNQETDRETFKRTALDIGFKSLAGSDPYARHSEHPFVESVVDGVKINIVPCYEITDCTGELKSAADRSVLHANIMRESLSDTMKRDVRLFKAFLKAGNLYGSEIAKQGVSGYVTEVLVFELGGFVEVMNTFADLEDGQVIGKPTGKFSGHVVIIDPVDGNRNLASAISPENLGGVVLRCREFLENPTVDMFVSRKTESSVPAENVVTVTFNYTDRSPDIISGQARKTASSLASRLTSNGFAVARYDALVDGNTVRLSLLLESVTIPALYIKNGPSVFKRMASTGFIESNRPTAKTIWVDGDDCNVKALAEREYTDAVSLLRNLIDNLPNTLPEGVRADMTSTSSVRVGQ